MLLVAGARPPGWFVTAVSTPFTRRTGGVTSNVRGWAEVQAVRVSGLVNLVFLVGIEFQTGAYQLFQMEGVALLVRLRRVFIVRVLFQVILGREKRAQTPEL